MKQRGSTINSQCTWAPGALELAMSRLELLLGCGMRVMICDITPKSPPDLEVLNVSIRWPGPYS